MFEVDTNNIVAVTRGDTFKAPLFINKGTDLKPIRYVLNDKDELYLGVMQTNQYFEDAILKKKFTNKNLDENNDVLIKFTSDDTTCLLPGKYYYQIKAKLYNEKTQEYEVNTIVEKTEFFILE